MEDSKESSSLTSILESNDIINEDEIPQNQNLTPEDIKFGQDHPFKTIVKLSVIPAFLQTASSIHDAIDLIYMRKAYGSEKYIKRFDHQELR